MFEVPRWDPAEWLPQPIPEARTYVALLVDYPILLRAIHATDPDAVPNLAAMVRRAMVLGPLFAARAYGAWYDTDEALHAFQAGVTPVFVPPAGAGTVPTASALIADGLALIENEQVSALALSGDDRLIPLAEAARARGFPVTLVAYSGRPDGPLAELAESVEPAPAFARTLSRAEKYRRPPRATSA